MRRAFMLLIVLFSGCRWPVRACWAPRDESPGWKEVALPLGAPQLAAPPTIDQYRSNERALAWHERGTLSAFSSTSGSADFWLELDGERADAVEVTFAARLGGAVVEARALTTNGSYVILPPTRSHATTLRLELSDPSTATIILTVHHHLRAQPRLMAWRAGQWQIPPGEKALLVYRQPAGQSILLCNRPEQTMTFHSAWETEPPRRVSLARAYWTVTKMGLE
jgi:hypothetical protein